MTVDPLAHIYTVAGPQYGARDCSAIKPHLPALSGDERLELRTVCSVPKVVSPEDGTVANPSCGATLWICSEHRSPRVDGSAFDGRESQVVPSCPVDTEFECAARNQLTVVHKTCDKWRHLSEYMELEAALARTAEKNDELDKCVAALIPEGGAPLLSSDLSRLQKALGDEHLAALEAGKRAETAASMHEGLVSALAVALGQIDQLKKALNSAWRVAESRRERLTALSAPPPAALEPPPEPEDTAAKERLAQLEADLFAARSDVVQLRMAAQVDAIKWRNLLAARERTGSGLKAQLEAATRAQASADRALEAVAAERDALRGEIRALRATTAEERDRAARAARGALDAAEARITDLEAALARASMHEERCDAAAAEAAARAQLAEAELERARAALRRAEDAGAAAQRRADEAAARLREAAAQLAAAETDARTRDAENFDLRGQLEHARASLAASEESRTRGAAEAKAAAAAAASAREKAVSEALARERSVAADSARVTRERHEAQLARLTADLAEARSSRDDLSVEVTRLRAQVREMETVLQLTRTELESVRKRHEVVERRLQQAALEAPRAPVLGLARAEHVFLLPAGDRRSRQRLPPRAVGPEAPPRLTAAWGVVAVDGAPGRRKSVAVQGSRPRPRGAGVQTEAVEPPIEQPPTPPERPPTPPSPAPAAPVRSRPAPSPPPQAVKAAPPPPKSRDRLLANAARPFPAGKLLQRKPLADELAAIAVSGSEQQRHHPRGKGSQT